MGHSQRCLNWIKKCWLNFCQIVQIKYNQVTWMVSLLNFAKKTNLRWSIPSNMLLRLKRIAFALSTPKMNMSQHSMPNWGAKWLSAFKKWLLKHICLDDFWVFPGAKMMIFLNIQNPTHPPQQKNPKTDWQPLQNLIIQRSSLKLTLGTWDLQGSLSKRKG